VSNLEIRELVLKAKFLFEKGMFRKAAEFLEEKILEHPNSAVLYWNIGDLYALIGFEIDAPDLCSEEEKCGAGNFNLTLEKENDLSRKLDHLVNSENFLLVDRIAGTFSGCIDVESEAIAQGKYLFKKRQFRAAVKVLEEAISICPNSRVLPQILKSAYFFLVELTMEIAKRLDPNIEFSDDRIVKG
jgi:tetratricopeptide (TPR) repeat protein